MSENAALEAAPPSNAEIERALLGAILMAPKRLEDVSDMVRPEHFYDTLHNLIYTTMSNLAVANKPIDVKSLGALLNGMGLYDDAGGSKYLAGLAGSAITTLPAAVRSYGETIVDLSLRRDLIEHANDLKAECYGAVGERPAREIMESHENGLLKLAGLTDSGGGLVPFHKTLTATYEQWEREEAGEHGVPTGFVDLDKLIGGLHPSDLIVVAGRSSMGKSAFAVNAAFNAAMFFKTSTDVQYRGKSVAFFSLEMSKEQIGSRIVTGKTKIIAPRNRWGTPMVPDEWATAMALMNEHGSLPFWIDDTADQSLSRIRARCVRLHRRRPLGLIVIDYLQLISPDGKGAKDNRVEQISQITRGLKKMAKELNVPVMALSQLSRAVEQRENKRPQLSDLRESGSIENDADVVLFPFRPEYYLKMDGKPVRTVRDTDEGYSSKVSAYHAAIESSANKCEVIVGKQRHGPLGSADLYFDSNLTWFSNLSDHKPDPAQENLI